MDCPGTKLKRSLLVIATGTMILSAAAQESGQDIIFSAPKADGSQAVTPSLTPQSSQSPILPDTLLAPVPAFPSGPPPGYRLPPPAINYYEQQRLKQLQAERRNWALMTPAEIFGVTTTEKLLQPPERDAFGREKKTTQLERYLERENQAGAGLTNGWRRDRANSPWGFSGEDDKASPFGGKRYGTADPAENLNRFLDSQQKNKTSAYQNGNPDGTGFHDFDAFAQKKTNQEKIEKQAAMERFRQMLQPSPEPVPNSPFFPVPKLVVDRNMTQPDFVPNPAGASFQPLNSSIGRPTGLTPLPGIVTPQPEPVVIPSWKPKPPPWLSQSAQPTAFPDKQF